MIGFSPGSKRCGSRNCPVGGEIAKENKGKSKIFAVRERP
jgi:hypothetical protein